MYIWDLSIGPVLPCYVHNDRSTMKLPCSLQLFIVTLAVLLQACALPFAGNIGDTGLSKEEFAQYVEEVFRFQNRMTSEVMMLTTSDESGHTAALLQSEQHMQQVCAPLNEFVSRDIDGLSTSFTLRRQVVKTSLACDRAAHEVEVLLKR